MIGDGIQVSVLAVMGEKVRIGIEAPRSVPVFRKEVWVEIQRDQEGDASVDVQKALEELKGNYAGPLSFLSGWDRGTPPEFWPIPPSRRRARAPGT